MTTKTYMPIALQVKVSESTLLLMTPLVSVKHKVLLVQCDGSLPTHTLKLLMYK